MSDHPAPGQSVNAKSAAAPAKSHLLKKILVVLIALITVFAVVVAFQPSDFRIERTASIDAPPPVVFAQVNDFHKWEAWSPWAKLDPNAKSTFEGPESGKGAKFGWAGNRELSEANMTITASNPHEKIDIQLEFTKPMVATNLTEFTFRPTEDGKTTVTWAMSGKNDFVGRAFCLFMNMDKMVGSKFEEGLASMKKIAEAEAKKTEKN